MLRIDQPRAFPRATFVAFSVVVATNGAASAKARARIAPDPGAEGCPGRAAAGTLLLLALCSPNTACVAQPGAGAAVNRSGDRRAAQRRERCAAPPQSDEPFGLMTFRAASLLWVKWDGRAAMTAESV
jgi:hypothetical protein